MSVAQWLGRLNTTREVFGSTSTLASDWKLARFLTSSKMGTWRQQRRQKLQGKELATPPHPVVVVYTNQGQEEASTYQQPFVDFISREQSAIYKTKDVLVWG